VAPWVLNARIAGIRCPVPAWCPMVLSAGPDQRAAGCGSSWLALVRWAGEGTLTSAHQTTLLPMPFAIRPLCVAQASPSGPRNFHPAVPVNQLMVLRHLNRLQVSVGLPFHLGASAVRKRARAQPRLATLGMKRLSISCSTAHGLSEWRQAPPFTESKQGACLATSRRPRGPEHPIHQAACVEPETVSCLVSNTLQAWPFSPRASKQHADRLKSSPSGGRGVGGKNFRAPTGPPELRQDQGFQATLPADRSARCRWVCSWPG